MEKNKNTDKNKDRIAVVHVRRYSHHLRVLIFCSLLAAMSVVLGQYLAIKIGNSVRIGFGALPVAMAGMLYGPLAGIVVGAVGDIVGCMIFYGLGELVPLITLGMMAEGAIAGLIARKMTPPRIVIGVMTGRIVGSALIKGLGLWLRYHTPFTVLVGRVPIILVEGVLTSILLILLLCSNQAVQKAFRGYIQS